MSSVVSLQAFGSSRPLQTIEEASNSDHQRNDSRLQQCDVPSHSSRPATSLREDGPARKSRGDEWPDEHTSASARDHRTYLFPVRGPHTSSLPQQQPQQQSEQLPQDSDSSRYTSSAINSPRDSGNYSTPTSILPHSSKEGQSSNEDQTLAPQDEYDLAAPVINEGDYIHSLETLATLLYGPDHLRTIFADPSTLLDFTSFLSACRSTSVPMLMYYLDATEALKAAHYAVTISQSLEPIPGHDFTATLSKPTWHQELKDKADQAFMVLVKDDLPAFVTQIYIQTVKSLLIRRAVGPPSPSTKDLLRGMLEAFCLTDPSRPGNPIVFASEAFHRMTEFSLGYVIGRNCRFLQGPQTPRASIERVGKAVAEGRDHCEVILNYRRDGSPFMNLLMLAPLRDVNGKIRYFLGAQIDVSELVPDSVDPEAGTSLPKLPPFGLAGKDASPPSETDKRDHQPSRENEEDPARRSVNKDGHELPPSHLAEPQPQFKAQDQRPGMLVRHSFVGPHANADPVGWVNTKLSGFYQNYLLVRPYPSLRVLFASPSLQSSEVLQASIMDRISVASSVRDELLQALVDCRSVTVKARWVSNPSDPGSRRWVAFTPLIGGHLQVGVWVAILVDDDSADQRRLRPGPSVRYRASAPAADPNALRAHDNMKGQDLVNSVEREYTPVSFSDKPRSVRARSRSGARESPPPSPNPPSISPSRSALGLEIDDTYETLEERLMKKRGRDAARLRDNPNAAVKPTYKSLSPYAFMNNDIT